MKAGWMRFQEEQLPILKAENPKLRLSQLNELLQKKWQKSPDNPMNQAHISHDATRDQERSALVQKKKETLETFRVQ
ncbi:hypothetical protein HDU91_000092 [Kappamyces sp. JEL0680]|nr:hypothetical protein HDU91_000092 [Kappamyces sp. JEL0680]